MLQSFSRLSITYRNVSKTLKLIRRVSKTIFWLSFAIIGILAVLIVIGETYSLITSDKSTGNYTIQDLRNNQK